MRKNILFWLLIAALFIFSGCEDKKTTTEEVITDLDQIEIILIDNWDLWEINSDATLLKQKGSNMNPIYGKNRELIGYPFLVEELYLDIQKHKIFFGDEIYDSGDADMESLHLIDNQLWTVDINGVEQYYYDYFYNEETGALWFRAETTPEAVWALDPTVEEDSLGNNLYDADDFMLFFRYGNGPKLILTQPQNNWIIPDYSNTDLNDLTPKFKWNAFVNASQYKFQLSTDQLFEDNLVYDEVFSGNTTQFTVPTNLNNFSDYYWRVKANNSNWSEVWYFFTKEVVVLQTPTNNSYISLKPTLQWADLNGATSYTVQISKNALFTNDIIEAVVSQSEYTLTQNLDANEEYFWRVTADNSQGHWSSIWKFTTDRGVNISNATPSNAATEVSLPVAFSWPALPNAATYTIQVSPDVEFTSLLINETINTNSYTESGVLNLNEHYYWRLNSDVAADWSDVSDFYTNFSVLLTAPENEETNVGLIVKFEWQKFAAGSTTYIIQIDETDTFADPIIESDIYFANNNLNNITCDTASLINYDSGTGLISYIPLLLEDFDNLTTYYWRVQRDNIEWSEIWSFETTSASSELTLTEPAEDADNVKMHTRFKWSTQSGALYYRLLVSLDPDFTEPLWLNKVVESNSYTLSEDEGETLLLAETYYWKARSDRGHWSDVWTFNTIDGIPHTIELMNNPETPNKVDIHWSASADDFTGFNIERKDNGEWLEIGTVDGSERNFVDFALASNTSHEYRIKSSYPLGFSDYSEIAEITTASFSFDFQPEMVEVPGGDFTMGSENGDDDEMPLHSVTLTNMYEMGIKEITNNEYCEVLNWAFGNGKVKGEYDINGLVYPTDAFNISNLMIANKANISFNVGTKIYNVDNGMGDYPVTGITFFGAVAYCNWLSMIHGETTLYSGTTSITRDPYAGVGYRLPTEAEWEYAATGRYSSAGYLYSGSNNIDDVAWHFGNAGSQVNMGGLKNPNQLGIYDMSGNLWEWCNDIFGAYTAASQTDPVGPTGNVGSNQEVVIRGGSWEYNEYHLRNTNRSKKRANQNTEIGFRVVKIHP